MPLELVGLDSCQGRATSILPQLGMRKGFVRRNRQPLWGQRQHFSLFPICFNISLNFKSMKDRKIKVSSGYLKGGNENRKWKISSKGETCARTIHFPQSQVCCLQSCTVQCARTQYPPRSKPSNTLSLESINEEPKNDYMPSILSLKLQGR